MRLILIRHGETQLNRDGRIQGVNDSPLNTTGRAQAKALALALMQDLPLLLYASPVARAMETAQVISEALKVPFTLHGGLAEAAAGELEGLTGAEMRLRYPEFAERWAADSGSAQMPGGESLGQVQERAWCAVSELLEKHPDDTVAVVTHNFTIQTILCMVLETPLRNSRRFRQDLGSITRLDLAHELGALVSLNETWHLWSIAAKRG